MPDFPPHSAAPAPQMALNLHELLPLRALVITLGFLAPARPAFFHQPALTAFIRHLLGNPENYEQLLVLDMPEAGRIRYQAGDLYRFQVIGLDGSDALLERLIEQLKQLPESAPVTDGPAPFRDNWQLHSLQDGFAGTPVGTLAECSQYSTQQLTEEALLWQSQPLFHWQWLSPARLTRPKEQRKHHKKQLDQFVRDLPDLPPALLLSRLYDAAATLLRQRGQATAPRPASPPLQLHDGQLFWLEHSYSDNQGNSKVMGGLHGQLSLHSEQPLDISWWRLLILGQYLGLGQRRGFGWGRYQLVTPQQQISYRRIAPARPLLDTVARPDNLQQALAHVQRNSRSQQDPQPEAEALPESQQLNAYETEPQQHSGDSLVRLQRWLQQIEQGRYSTPALRGWLISKANGSYRPLAVPPFWDRVLQRAVAQMLTPGLEQLMHEGSFGYRRGRSRQQAMEQIRRAVRQGYCWVFESDLKDFFDSVNPNHLEIRLRSLYGDDPLVDQMLRWMAADVQFQGETLARKNGLPQGSPLSPLLANLMLDDFDNDMQAAGFKLIRFADDFVVMCRSPEEARAAEDVVDKSWLSELSASALHRLTGYEDNERIRQLVSPPPKGR